MSAVIYHLKAIETSALIESFFFLFLHSMWILGLSGWLSSKESACQCQRNGFNPCAGKIPWRRKWQPTPVFLPGNPKDRETWWPTAHGAKTKQLNNFLGPRPEIKPTPPALEAKES